MRRRSTTRRLGIWMNGERVGTWAILTSGLHEFRYDAGWLDYPDVRPISLSMPLADPEISYTGPVAESFFENLLPDSADIRRRLQARFSARTNSAFDLLAEIGRDCVGAIQLLPDGEIPQNIRSIAFEPLDEAGVAGALRNAVAAPGFGYSKGGDLRISIAGAQECPCRQEEFSQSAAAVLGARRSRRAREKLQCLPRAAGTLLTCADVRRALGVSHSGAWEEQAFTPKIDNGHVGYRHTPIQPMGAGNYQPMAVHCVEMQGAR